MAVHAAGKVIAFHVLCSADSDDFLGGCGKGICGTRSKVQDPNSSDCVLSCIAFVESVLSCDACVFRFGGSPVFTVEIVCVVLRSFDKAFRKCGAICVSVFPDLLCCLFVLFRLFLTIPTGSSSRSCGILPRTSAPKAPSSKVRSMFVSPKKHARRTSGNHDIYLAARNVAECHTPNIALSNNSRPTLLCRGAVMGRRSGQEDRSKRKSFRFRLLAHGLYRCKSSRSLAQSGRDAITYFLAMVRSIIRSNFAWDSWPRCSNRTSSLFAPHQGAQHQRQHRHHSSRSWLSN